MLRHDGWQFLTNKNYPNSCFRFGPPSSYRCRYKCVCVCGILCTSSPETHCSHARKFIPQHTLQRASVDTYMHVCVRARSIALRSLKDLKLKLSSYYITWRPATQSVVASRCAHLADFLLLQSVSFFIAVCVCALTVSLFAIVWLLSYSAARSSRQFGAVLSLQHCLVH